MTKIARREQNEINSIIKQFEDDDMQEDLAGVWDFLMSIAKREGIELLEVPMSPADIKISLVFTKFLLEDRTEFTPREIIETARVTQRAYTAWEFMSELGRFCKRVDKIVGRERMQGQTRMVQKKLVEWAEAGDKKAAEMFLRTTGQYDGEKESADGVFVEVIEKYDEEAIEKATAKRLELPGVKPEPTPVEELKATLHVAAKEAELIRREGKKGYFNPTVKTLTPPEKLGSASKIQWQKVKEENEWAIPGMAPKIDPTEEVSPNA